MSNVESASYRSGRAEDDRDPNEILLMPTGMTTPFYNNFLGGAIEKFCELAES